jgi:methylmalonyl-CoA mutase cobalamin-binding subunit
MRDDISALLQKWRLKGKPTREDYLAGARTLESLRRESPRRGLWPKPPLMITATLDDGWGHGLDVIEALAAAVGVAVHRLGVLQRPEGILATCREQQADLLGLTVLQFDSDDDLTEITRGLPPETTLIAGGAAFVYDPEFAARTGTLHVARDGAAFLRFLIGFNPIDRGGIAGGHHDGR